MLNTEQQNLKQKLVQACEWGGNYLIPENSFFFKEDVLSYTIKIDRRIQKHIHKLTNAYKNMYLTFAKTENLSSREICYSLKK